MIWKKLADFILKRKSIKFETDITKEELTDISNKLDLLEPKIKPFFTGYNYTNIYGIQSMKPLIHNIFNDIAIDLYNNTVETKQDIEIEYDICYYGDNRGTYRNNKVKSYFNTDKIKSLLIGVDLEMFNNTFLKKVKHTELPNLVMKSHSSLVVGDAEHENAFITMRFYENIIFKVVSFIDINYDKNKELFKNQILKDFNYITSKEDLITKLDKIKNDPEFKKQIILLQIEELLNSNLN